MRLHPREQPVTEARIDLTQRAISTGNAPMTSPTPSTCDTDTPGGWE